jgi:hypothetical protein
MVDGVEDVLIGDAVPARRVVNLHPLIVIRKEPFKSFSARRSVGLKPAVSSVDILDILHFVESLYFL